MRSIITLLSVVITSTLFACDICGGYVGITPYDNHSSLSAMYRYKMFNGYHHAEQQHQLFMRNQSMASHQSTVSTAGNYNTLKHGGSHTSPAEPEPQYLQEDFELFTSIELRAKLFIHKRIELNTIIPFAMNSSRNGAQKETISGIGDLSFTAGFHVGYRTDTKVQQRLIIGGGVKLPVGDYYAKNEQGERIDYLLQPGNGSVDYLVNLNYVFGFKKIGLNFNSSYKFNGENYYGEKIDNSAANYLAVFYKFRQEKQLKLYPSVQCYEEYTKGLYIHNVYQPATEMSVITAGAGLDVFYKQLMLSLSYQAPVYEKAFDHNLAMAGKLMIGLTFNFDQQKYLLKSKKES